MTSRSQQYIPCHWDGCSNHPAISDFCHAHQLGKITTSLSIFVDIQGTIICCEYYGFNQFVPVYVTTISQLMSTCKSRNFSELFRQRATIHADPFCRVFSCEIYDNSKQLLNTSLSTPHVKHCNQKLLDCDLFFFFFFGGWGWGGGFKYDLVQKYYAHQVLPWGKEFGVRTHNLQIMTVNLMSLRRLF